MLKTKLHYLALLVTTPLVFAEQTVRLKIEGIEDKELYNNVRIFLSQVSNDEADGSERYQYVVRETVDKALRALGYYNTQYHFHLTPRKAPAKDLLTLKVSLDKPVKLDEREVDIQGQAAQDSDFQQLLEKDIPTKGTRLNHETYDNFKSNIEKLAQSKGYFDGNWRYHRLEVYSTSHTADWRLGYHSGERYRYGDIRFKNSQIREDYLTQALRIQSGDEYHINDLSKLSSDFSSSNWFASVLVEPELNSEKKEVDLNVLLQPKKKNDVEIGIGYMTQVGPRFQLNWKKPWINDRGHSLEMNSYFSLKEQKIEFGYNIPLRNDPINHYYQISGGLEREKQNDTKFTGANLAFQRFWNYESGWNFSLGMKARYDAFEQANDKFKTLLLYPTASLNRTRSDGQRFPLWGDSQKLTVNWGSKLWGSDVNFYSAKASTAWIRTYADAHRFYLRGELGYLKAGEFGRIPPALRYFAGGDMSVRGFGYKKISPKNKDGELTGGSHLATATAEYQYQVYPNWWGAVFYDTGLAARQYKAKDLHSGVGVGVRWASPIGAIKFDLATPVRSPSNEKGIQFYIGLGSEL
ncbi:outer membrane protein assembly factor [Muribacter muris]|uniref:Translocation and assembly module subunit TamA n=1 Tax=Muribacter muris TaxID=67855 RepID=A0A4Y9K808_9PAST|nr:autotransporter assembly complex family protein [Muribacter muris]MBF0783903.1 outer membrane protein assembly factor [Muribacter muris]MBF0826401.1 outer membrane protein assembly factor [Muribacter muris]TFV13299.1 outer membrane protein assembly factor [Muribacter muris]